MIKGFHREGKTIILSTVAIIAATNIAVFSVSKNSLIYGLTAAASLIILVLILQFFRVPVREANLVEGNVLCPADGKVVTIEKVIEKEFFNEERIQVSIFMSPLNVHINWYPISGKVLYEKYHPGKFLVAWHPKSSELNERTTVVVENEEKKSVLFRQIAGAVARRIVCYSKKNEDATKGGQFGFIKFGSRVDLLLPTDAEILVNVGDKVQGITTQIAKI